MEEGIALVHESVLGVEDLRISRVNNVANDVGELIHFRRLPITSRILAQVLLVLIFLLFLKFFLFLYIHPHHVLFAYLVKSFAHLDWLPLVDLVELLDANELYVLQRTSRRCLHLRVQDLRQEWIGWELALHGANNSIPCTWKLKRRHLRLRPILYPGIIIFFVLLGRTTIHIVQLYLLIILKQYPLLSVVV